jgi:hypothetical protein
MEEQKETIITTVKMDAELTYGLSPFIEAVRMIMNTDLFGETMKKSDVVNLLKESTLTARLTQKEVNDLAEWQALIPTTTAELDLEANLSLMFLCRIQLAMKLNIEPSHLQFVGNAHLNKPLKIRQVDDEARHVFFVIHPTQVRSYDAHAKVGGGEFLYMGTKYETDIPPFVIVFSAPNPDKVKYNPMAVGCYIG